MDQKRFRMDQQNGKIMVDDTVDGAKEEREDLEKIYLTSLWHIEHNEYNPGNGSIPHSKAAEVGKIYLQVCVDFLSGIAYAALSVQFENPN